MSLQLNLKLHDQKQTLDIDSVLKAYPWLLQESKKCILSPDCDGLLCGLFMTHFLDWKVVGYYDGKVLLIKEGESCYDPDVVFLDMEVFRRNVKSVGHHMVLYNKNKPPSNWSQFESACQPNIMRRYDALHDFQLKYPLATIHFLLSVTGTALKVRLPTSAICPLFFADGTFQVLYLYPENVLNWLNYLNVGHCHNPLKDVFLHDHYTVHSQIVAMDAFFRQRDAISIPKERGDKFVLSGRDGSPRNIYPKKDGTFSIAEPAVAKVCKFIELLRTNTKWTFTPHKWTFSNLKLCRFTKGDFAGSKLKLNGQNYVELMAKNPLSWAITSQQNIEYTIEEPDQLL